MCSAKKIIFKIIRKVIFYYYLKSIYQIVHNKKQSILMAYDSNYVMLMYFMCD